MKRRILFDLNVVLDVLLDRPPHAAASSALWAAVEAGDAEGMLAAHCVTTLHDLATRSGGQVFGDRCVADVLSVFRVAGVDHAVIREALAMGWPDFGDAVCAAAAMSANCHLIATRDPRGFKAAKIPALAPIEALAAIRTAKHSA